MDAALITSGLRIMTQAAAELLVGSGVGRCLGSVVVILKADGVALAGALFAGQYQNTAGKHMVAFEVVGQGTGSMKADAFRRVLKGERVFAWVGGRAAKLATK